MCRITWKWIWTLRNRKHSVCYMYLTILHTKRMEFAYKKTKCSLECGIQLYTLEMQIGRKLYITEYWNSLVQWLPHHWKLFSLIWRKTPYTYVGDVRRRPALWTELYCSWNNPWDMWYVCSGKMCLPFLVSIPTLQAAGKLTEGRRHKLPAT